ncbi:hypothetical protein ACVWWK_006196 [Bradyrhizobium sp. LB9.1b]
MLPWASSITEPRTPGEMRQHLGMSREMIAGLVEGFLVERSRDDGRGPSRLRQAHALLDRLVGEASAVRAQYAGLDRVALDVGLEEAEVRPVTILSAHFRDRNAGTERSFRAIERRATADDQQTQIARRDPVLQPDAGLDDDLRPDPGRIAHGDGKMARGHVGLSLLSK